MGSTIDERLGGMTRGRSFAGLRPVVAMALALALAGCATRPGMLTPVASIPGTDRVDILTATTRAPSDDAGLLYTGDRGDDVSFRNIVVSIPPRREVGTIQLPERVPGNPATDFVVTSETPVAKTDLAGWFRATGGRKRRVLVFVHGFNTRFDRAVFRLAQLAHDVDAEAAPVLFSWPSRGQVLDYRRDFDNASYSRSDLAHLLKTAAASQNIGEIVILAHSLGSWPAMEAIRQLALERGGVPPKITNLILASPDLDIGVFRRQVEDMGPRRPHITLFVSPNDRALHVSRFIARGATRLGGIDLAQEQYQQQLAGLTGVKVLDLSAVGTDGGLNHDLFATSPDVVHLIGERLRQGQVMTDPDSDSASPFAAAGLLIATPIRIFNTASP